MVLEKEVVGTKLGGMRRRAASRREGVTIGEFGHPRVRNTLDTRFSGVVTVQGGEDVGSRRTEMALIQKGPPRKIYSSRPESPLGNPSLKNALQHMGEKNARERHTRGFSKE